MTFVITPYAIISGIGACMAFIVALIAWQRQETPGGKSLTAMMLAAAIWAWGAAMEHATIGIPGQIFWSKIQYIGTVSCPVLLLTFALEYNHFYRWLTQRNIALVFIVPLITLVLAFTNEWHSLIWTSFSPSPAGNNIIIFGHGIGFWVGAVGYSYFVMMVGTILLIRGALSLSAPYRRQVVMVVTAAITPWIVNAIYIAGLSPVPGLELTPLVVVFTGAIFAWAIFQFQLLDLAPIARYSLVETMAEGMLVLDQQNRVVDTNPAAQRLLGKRAVIAIGKYIGDIFSAWPELKKLFFQNNPEKRTEMTVQNTGGDYLEISISPVHDRQDRFTGQFVVIRDITEKRRIQDEIQQANEHLRQQLAEIETLQAHLRERAIRDSLTGLFNRRYLDETLERELSRAKRDTYEISLLMIDIDHFKRLNDTNGHKAGDQILKALGDFLLAGVRQGDIVCRYGGEEFLIIMPGVHLKDAQYRAETICQGFSILSVKYEEMELRATISIGVAIFPQHGSSSDEIIRAADSAMYAAKQAGRNTVCVK
jgi:diguanylate cyclase (GGDEF)-like protein/PAS domain S-box-containing protein